MMTIYSRLMHDKLFKHLSAWQVWNGVGFNRCMHSFLSLLRPSNSYLAWFLTSLLISNWSAQLDISTALTSELAHTSCCIIIIQFAAGFPRTLGVWKRLICIHTDLSLHTAHGLRILQGLHNCTCTIIQ